MGKQVLYFLLPGLLSTYWLKDWSWVFLTVESLLNTTGFLNRSAAFCDRSARCSSVPFCWEKNRHTTVPFVYKREDINLKGTFLWGDRTQLLQSGFHSSGCGLYWMEVSAAGEKSRRVINFCFFFLLLLFNMWWQRLAFCSVGTLLQNSLLLYQPDLFIVTGICQQCRF